MSDFGPSRIEYTQFCILLRGGVIVENLYELFLLVLEDKEYYMSILWRISRSHIYILYYSEMYVRILSTCSVLAIGTWVR